jgi:hypothetical protein
MTQKFSQSHFRIQTRSQRHSEGPHPRPRRLTKALPKQANFRVTLLRVSLLRECTSPDLVRVHCCYWSMVVLWPGLHSSGDLPVTWR